MKPRPPIPVSNTAPHPPAIAPGRQVPGGHSLLLRMLPILLGCVALLSVAWPMALPRGVRVLLPIFFLVAVFGWTTALGLGRIPDRRSYPIVLLVGLATSLIPIVLLVLYAGQTWDPPRIFPAWWLFFLIGGVWLSLLTLRWAWGRQVGLSFILILLFVASMEPGFGIHPAWAVFAGVLVFTGWGIADRCLAVEVRARMAPLLLLWLLMAALLSGAIALSYSTVWNTLFTVRQFMGLHGPALVERPSGGFDPDGDWVDGDELTSPTPSPAMDLGDAMSARADEDPLRENRATAPRTSDSSSREGASSRGAALPRVSLEDPVLNQQDRTPLFTVFVRRSWESRVSSVMPRGELRLWKTGTLDRFNGRAWELSSTGGALFPADSKGRIVLTDLVDWNSHELIGQEITIHNAELGGLPHVGRPVAIAAGIDLVSWDASGSLLPSTPLRPRQTVRLFSVSPRSMPPPEEMPFASTLELPKLPQRIHDLAFQLGVQQANTHPEAYLTRVLDYLGVNCVYALEEPLPKGPDLLGSFLFETQRGTCEHFASAFAVLARLGGIPARLAVGLGVGYDLDVEVEPVTLTRADRHAWVEVWSPEAGWVAVDPSNPDVTANLEAPAYPTAEPLAQTPWLLYLLLGVSGILLGGLIAWAMRRLRRIWSHRPMEPIRIRVQVAPAPRREDRHQGVMRSMFNPEFREEARLWKRHRRIVHLLESGGVPPPDRRIRQRFWEGLTFTALRQNRSVEKFLVAYERSWRASLFSEQTGRDQELERTGKELEAWLRAHADELAEGIQKDRERPV